MSEKSLRTRISDFLTSMHGRAPTASEIDAALAGYHAEMSTLNALEKLPETSLQAGYAAELQDVIHQVHGKRPARN